MAEGSHQLRDVLLWLLKIKVGGMQMLMQEFISATYLSLELTLTGYTPLGREIT